MKGKIKIKGNMGLAMKLNAVTAATKKYMESHKGAPATKKTSGDAGQLKSAEAFKLIGEAIESRGPEFVKKVNGVIQFDITPGMNMSFTYCVWVCLVVTIRICSYTK